MPEDRPPDGRETAGSGLRIPRYIYIHALLTAALSTLDVPQHITYLDILYNIHTYVHAYTYTPYTHITYTLSTYNTHTYSFYLRERVSRMVKQKTLF